MEHKVRVTKIKAQNASDYCDEERYLTFENKLSFPPLDSILVVFFVILFFCVYVCAWIHFLMNKTGTMASIRTVLSC